MNLFYKLALIMGLVVVLSNYLVQFPIKYFGLNDANLINAFILFAIEIFYFTWSFLSYKTNLSDWIVTKPQKGDITPFLNIFIFYFFIIIYYAVLT